jgi:hypothetical protein
MMVVRDTILMLESNNNNRNNKTTTNAAHGVARDVRVAVNSVGHSAAETTIRMPMAITPIVVIPPAVANNNVVQAVVRAARVDMHVKEGRWSTLGIAVLEP